MAVKVKRPDHDDLASLHEHGPRETHGGTVHQRRGAAGRKPVRGTDRRKKSSGKREKQYNTNVTKEVWDLVARLLNIHDLTKAEFTERAIRHYAEHLKKLGGQRA